jgi:regulator of protease activity HflC (stomatin/prohibitin superfamily)
MKSLGGKMTEFILVLIFAFVIGGLRVCNQYVRCVHFRLGKFQSIKGPGLFWIIPLIEWVQRVDMRTITASVDAQDSITKDNVPIKVSTVIWYRAVNPEKAVIEVVDVRAAVIQVSLTTQRTLIGQYTLDDVLKEQAALSKRMAATIDEATEPWGVKVERVEMRNVEIPVSMQNVMAQEAEALREKRARIIKAEAEKEAAAQLCAAADMVMKSPAALELRRMQMITEVGAEQNTTTIVMMPSEFVSMAGSLANYLKQKNT